MVEGQAIEVTGAIDIEDQELGLVEEAWASVDAVVFHASVSHFAAIPNKSDKESSDLAAFRLMATTHMVDMEAARVMNTIGSKSFKLSTTRLLLILKVVQSTKDSQILIKEHLHTRDQIKEVIRRCNHRDLLSLAFLHTVSISSIMGSPLLSQEASNNQWAVHHRHSLNNHQITLWVNLLNTDSHLTLSSANNIDRE